LSLVHFNLLGATYRLTWECRGGSPFAIKYFMLLTNIQGEY